MAFETDDYTADVPETAPDAPAVPEGSAFATLRAERANAAEKVHLELRVPRWETPVFVRYKAPEKKRIQSILNAAQKKRDHSVTPEAVLLAENCIGVYEKDPDGNPIGNPDEWPRFDEALAAYLGVDAKRAVDVVKALFVTEGDITRHSAELMTWAGFATGDVDDLYSGN